jgi:hypothetical protein
VYRATEKLINSLPYILYMTQYRNIENHKKWRRAYYKRTKRKYLDRQAIYEAAYKIKMKYELVMMLGAKCNDCGYDKNPFVLEFHHPGEKNYNMSDMFHGGVSKERMIKEVKKCFLLCPICHNRRHVPSIKLWEKYHSIEKIIEIVKRRKRNQIKKRKTRLI